MRERTTWDRGQISRARKVADDPAALVPEHIQQQPAEDAYVTGGPSEFAEDVHPSTEWKQEYEGGATKRNDIGMPEFRSDTFKGASDEHLLKKAELCGQIATFILPKTASLEVVEDQAVALMHIPDSDLVSMSHRLSAEEEDEEDESEDEDEKEQQAQGQGQQQKKQAQTLVQCQQLLQAFQAGDMQQAQQQIQTMIQSMLQQAQQQQAPQQQAQGQGQQQDQVQQQQAQDQGQQAQQQQTPQQAQQQTQQQAQQQAPQQAQQQQQQAQQLEAAIQTMVQQALQQQGYTFGQQQPQQGQQQQAPQQAQQQQQQAQQQQQQADDMLLDQMLQGELGQGVDQGFSEADIELGPSMDDEAVLGPEDEVLQDIFASTSPELCEAKEALQGTASAAPVHISRTASTRTVGTRPTQGVSTLGGMGKSASQGSDIDKLSALWQSAPDVRNVFRT